MVKNAFFKTVLRTFLSNKGRFFANFVTVLLSVSITAGLGAIPVSFNNSYALNFKDGNVPDLIVKSKSYTGFTQEEVDRLQSMPGVTASDAFFVMDEEEGEHLYNRFYVYDFDSLSCAKPRLLEGKYPTARGEVLVEQGNTNRTSFPVGEKLHFNGLSFFAPSELTVVGVCDSPLLNTVAKERAMLEDEKQEEYLTSVFYIEQKTVPSFLRSFHSDVYLRFDTEHAYLTDAYRDEMEKKAKDVDALLGQDATISLTLEENTSYALFRNYNEKVRKISFIFPLFFLLLCALVNHLTITRLIKDERPMIACYSSLGYRKPQITSKYLLFISTSVSLGAIAGYFLGAPLVPTVVLPAYYAVFQMNGLTPLWLVPVGIGVCFALVLISLLIAFFSSRAYLKEEPSMLMKEKSPKPGKKILLERIPLVWNHLSFRFKSAFRNIFRQKKNLILTSVSVMGATLLVLLGFSLLNVSDALKNDELFSNVASSMGSISAVIILFAIAMAVTVVYSLAVMNIEDRRRELATLMVLGYQSEECAMYTFREIMMTSAVSTVLALPISVFVISFAFYYLGFGDIADVQWWSYVASVAIIIGATLMIAGLLYPRIKRIDMTSSLKSVE